MCDRTVGIQKITDQFVQKWNEFKLYLIPYPKIPHLSSLENFFIVKFTIENRYFSKIAPFATLPISQYPGFLLENQRLRGRACFIIPGEVKYI